MNEGVHFTQVPVQHEEEDGDEESSQQSQTNSHTHRQRVCRHTNTSVQPLNTLCITFFTTALISEHLHELLFNLVVLILTFSACYSTAESSAVEIFSPL